MKATVLLALAVVSVAPIAQATARRDLGRSEERSGVVDATKRRMFEPRDEAHLGFNRHAEQFDPAMADRKPATPGRGLRALLSSARRNVATAAFRGAKALKTSAKKNSLVAWHTLMSTRL